MESALSDIGRTLKDREFGSIEEANAFLKEMVASGGGRFPSPPPASDLDRAQEIMYRAWEAGGTRRTKLAREALDISPDCADAYVLLAETAKTVEEALEFYRQGVAAGERAIGPKAFKEDEGHFWGILETRPYMRAREGLAGTLWELGREDEALEHYREMLRLNPNDNQGIRYLLVSLCLRTGRDEVLEELFVEYSDDGAATWLYGQGLHGFRAEGDTPRTRELLKEAMKSNSDVPPYLLGRKRLPKRLPEMNGMGDESEAVACASELLPAWQATPGALEWIERMYGS